MSQHTVYGFPCVIDPNDFIPDAESCSPAELDTHRLALQTYGTPAYHPNKGCTTEVDGSGRLMLNILRTSWGIGTNLVTLCDECHASSGDLMTCHECGGPEFCAHCWLEHEKKHDEEPA